MTRFVNTILLCLISLKVEARYVLVEWTEPIYYPFGLYFKQHAPFVKYELKCTGINGIKTVTKYPKWGTYSYNIFLPKGQYSCALRILDSFGGDSAWSDSTKITILN